MVQMSSACCSGTYTCVAGGLAPPCRCKESRAQHHLTGGGPEMTIAITEHINHTAIVGISTCSWPNPHVTLALIGASTAPPPLGAPRCEARVRARRKTSRSLLGHPKSSAPFPCETSPVSLPSSQVFKFTPLRSFFFFSYPFRQRHEASFLCQYSSHSQRSSVFFTNPLYQHKPFRSHHG